MLALKWLLMIVGAGLFGSAGALVAYDVYLSEQLRRLLSRNKADESGAEVGPLARRPLRPVRWRLALQLTIAGALLLVITESFAVIPDGAAGGRVSEIWGARPRTFYSRMRPIYPPGGSLANYITREIFATKREELRTTAADAITTRLASDGIIVREVLLRDLQLPQEYAKGLEGLLLKEQENERLGTEQEIKGKQVKIAELEAEAQKARDVKQAEAQAQVRVLQAKAEADAMQYTLPLKQKQIEQTKLEAQARKESTLQNAEAAAQAKIIDSKAEVERQKNLADAEANRIRVTAAADSERMKYEASVLKSNPMLIQKIIAERLSDKLQIMMVPIDGRNFFANDVMRSAFSGVASTGNSDDSPATATAAAQRKQPRRQ